MEQQLQQQQQLGATSSSGGGGGGGHKRPRSDSLSSNVSALEEDADPTAHVSSSYSHPTTATAAGATAIAAIHGPPALSRASSGSSGLCALGAATPLALPTPTSTGAAGLSAGPESAEADGEAEAAALAAVAAHRKASALVGGGLQWGPVVSSSSAAASVAADDSPQATRARTGESISSLVN